LQIQKEQDIAEQQKNQIEKKKNSDCKLNLNRKLKKLKKT